jgi:hypothetical protein
MAWGQSSRPSIGLQGQGAQSGAFAAIAGASTQNAIVRAATTNIALRPPETSDTAQGIGGLWIDQYNQPWQLPTIAGGIALWQKLLNPGVYPASAVPGALWSGGSFCHVSNWTNAALVVQRQSDNQYASIGCIAYGQLDISSALAFSVPSGGVLPVVGVHDETDGGAYDNVCTPVSEGTPASGTNPVYFCTKDATQFTFANAPILGIGTFGESQNGNVPIVFNSTLRNYLSSSHSFPATNTQGTTAFCITSNSQFTATMGPGSPGLWYLYTGMGASGTGVPANTTILDFTYTTGCGHLSANTTAAVTSLNFARQTGLTAGNVNVFMDLPSSLSVPSYTNAAYMEMRFGANFYNAQSLVTLGSTAETAQNSALNYFTLRNQFGINGPPTVINVGSNSVGSTFFGTGYATTNDQVVGWSNSGTHGQNFLYVSNGKIGSSTENNGTISSNALVSGSIGYNQQTVGAGVGYSADMAFYGLSIYGSSHTSSQIQTYEISADEALKVKPQATLGLVFDGSSHTVGTGGSSPFARPGQIAETLSAIQPVNVWDQGVAAGPSTNLYNFPTLIAPLVPSAAQTVVYQPGLGNGLQIAGNITISNMTLFGGVWTLTTPSALYANGYATTNIVPLSYLLGTPSGCLSVGAQVASITGVNTFTVSGSGGSAGSCTSVGVLNDTAANEWAEIVAYDALIGAASAQEIIDGQTSRSSFTTSTAPYGSGSQLGEFSTIHAQFLSVCTGAKFITTGIATSCVGLPNTKAYVDWELVSPYFGGDGGTTTVVGPVIAGNTITVNVPSGTLASNNLVAGNRIEWVGMPANMSPTVDTGGQTISSITSLTGTQATITLSSINSGLAGGQTIRAINPTPWLNFSCLTSPPSGPWMLDYQHMCVTQGWGPLGRLDAGLLTSIGALN